MKKRNWTGREKLEIVLEGLKGRFNWPASMRQLFDNRSMPFMPISFMDLRLPFEHQFPLGRQRHFQEFARPGGFDLDMRHAARQAP